MHRVPGNMTRSENGMSTVSRGCSVHPCPFSYRSTAGRASHGDTTRRFYTPGWNVRDEMRDRPRTATVLLVVASLLCVAAIGVTGLTGAVSIDNGGEPEVVSVTDSTNYLSPGAENLTRQEFGRAGLDVGATVLTDAERLQARHDRLSDDARRDSAATPEEAARGIVDRIERRVDALDRRQQQLFEAYSTGRMSTRTLLTELASLEVAVRNQRAVVERLQDQSLPEDLATRIDRLEVETVLLPNPVSDRIVTATAGADDPVDLYLGATSDGLVAATVVQGEYVRQATLRAERDPGGDDQFTAENPDVPAQAAFSRGAQLYPWAERSNADSRGFRGSSVYVFRANHSHGNLFTYLDGATTNPFHEYQFKRSAAVPVTETKTNTSQSLRLNLQYTDPTGPMLVSLIGSGGTVPPSATVTVDDQRVGEISGGGQLWTVQPIGTFSVTVTTAAGEEVSVTVPSS